jgi:hypothetical protein
VSIDVNAKFCIHCGTTCKPATASTTTTTTPQHVPSTTHAPQDSATKCCGKCAASLASTAKFCNHCGMTCATTGGPTLAPTQPAKVAPTPTPKPQPQPQPTPQPTTPSTSGSVKCIVCPAMLPSGKKFCLECGSNQSQQSPSQAQVVTPTLLKLQPPKSVYSSTPSPSAQPTVEDGYAMCECKQPILNTLKFCPV